MLHELVINGVSHGAADVDGMIEVSCWLDVARSHVVVSVHDEGTRGVVAVQPFTLDRPSGRGLATVAALSTAWTVGRSAGTTVTATLER